MKPVLVAAIGAVALTSCATAVANKTAQIEPGASASEVRAQLGPPQDRQFSGADEVWQYCGTGFVNDSFVAVFLRDGRVRRVQTYNDGQGDLGLCNRHFRTVTWGADPALAPAAR